MADHLEFLRFVIFHQPVALPQTYEFVNLYSYFYLLIYFCITVSCTSKLYMPLLIGDVHLR